MNIGFVSTRFAGTDGVSLESAKWSDVLRDLGHASYWFAGEVDRAREVSQVVAEAHFQHPTNRAIDGKVWGTHERDRSVTEAIHETSAHLKAAIYAFVEKFGIDLLVVQNALTVPMHIPLGVALTELIAETSFPTIAHHHDFYWERARFSHNAVGDYLRLAFPPALPSIQNVTINTAAQRALAHRTGLTSVVIPNVLDFAAPVPLPDDYSADFREQVGVAPDDLLILQPTRVVPRKGIEHAIALAAALRDEHAALVVTHASGDEGSDYCDALAEMATRSQVDLRFIADRIGNARAQDAGGRKTFSLWDAYAHADLVTFPSSHEGFGNALLEAFFARKPVVVNRYSVYVEDIEPKGFRVVAIDGLVTRSAADGVRRVLRDADYRRETVEHNFEVARRHFGYDVLRRELPALLAHAPSL